MLLYKHVPSISTRRDLLDVVKGFHATTIAEVKFYGDNNISVDAVEEKLSVGNRTYRFAPLLPPSIARPNVTCITREFETHDVTPIEEKGIIETATCDLESSNP